jgi:hypothetical protein
VLKKFNILTVRFEGEKKESAWKKRSLQVLIKKNRKKLDTKRARKNEEYGEEEYRYGEIKVGEKRCEQI